ncbi:MAG: SH3 domain-containing protein, partial [Caldilinea sp.]|nr:SH3 domain-containing protein [Caldilinea sp.]
MNNTHSTPLQGSSTATTAFLTRPIILLTALMLVAMALSGCVMQPVVAGALRQAPLPTDQGPIIAIAPIAATSGETVSVSGAGWTPGEVVFINLEGVQDGEQVQATLASGTADAEGRFFLAFVTPLDIFWQGVVDFQIVAYSLDGERSASVPFDLLPADLPATPAAPATPTVAAPTSTPTAQASGVGYGVATVSSRGLNMRTGPGTVYPVIRALVQGTRISVLGQDASGGWLYGQLADGTLGWVARAFTNYLGSPPIVAAPPTPVQRPTATATPLPTTQPTTQPGLAWRGEYYTNPSIMGTPRVVRNDAAIDFNWGFNAPAPGIPATGFSVRWSRTLYFSAGTYRFSGQSDGGVRVWVDNRLVLDQWGGVAGGYSVDVWLEQGSHTLFIDYGQRRQPALMTFGWTLAGPTPSPSFPDWRGEYFGNRDLAGNPVFVRNDPNIDFNWSWVSPAPGIGAENYSVRWSRTIDFSSGDYRFYVRSDDGVRVFVDGNRIINEWRDMSGNTTYTADRYLSGRHHIVVEYYQHTGSAFITFWWERIHATPTRTPTRTPTPTPSTPNPFADANPSSGPVGTQVTVSFGGFPP